MYFVRYGDICVRFTGKNWDERELPEFTSVYDYDDEKKYSLDELERESRRTDFGGAGRDEDAHSVRSFQAPSSGERPQSQSISSSLIFTISAW